MQQTDIFSQPEIWNEQQESFQFQYPFGDRTNEHCQRIRETFKHLFQQYYNIQDKLCLKYPYYSNFQIAKIQSIIPDDQGNFLFIKYTYDRASGDREEISYQNQDEPITAGLKKATPLSCHYGQDLKQLDIPSIKQVVQCLIESLHWAANYGLFLDPIEQNLLLLRDQDLFVFIPTFTIFTDFLFRDQIEFSWSKFHEFRMKPFQNATHIFLYSLVNEFKMQIKEQDEDLNLYKKITLKDNCPILNDLYKQQETLLGVDQLYSEEQVKKKMWRYTFKQSMILYQLDNNKQLRELFLKHKEIDQQIVQSSQEQKMGQQQQQQQQNKKLITQSENLKTFLNSLTGITSVSNDVLTSFAQKLLQNYLVVALKDFENKVQAAFRPYWKSFNNKHELKQYSQQGQQQKQQIEQDPNSTEYIWTSDINQSNIICQSITSSSTTIQNQKQLNIRYKLELLEAKQCYIIRTVIPEIVFSIDTADDILFLVNFIQKEIGTTNIYVDDNRRLTLYTSIVMGQKVEILPAVLKIFDLHQIYFYLILDFFAKNIAFGRSIKELKYQHFAKEILHYVADYEKDFDDQMKNIKNQVQIGF